MLNSLSIKNIAVIEKADIDLNPGFNVLTGETGAGKSILIDSINAILGERVYKEIIRNGTNEAEVSAQFCINEIKTKKLIEDFGFELEDDSVLISRKINREGKSTCRINGTLCNLSVLKQVAPFLINIHGQNDSQLLLNSNYHCSYLDSFGNLNNDLLEYKKLFKELLDVRKELKTATSNSDEKDNLIELLDFQIKEISDADIHINESEELKTELSIIENSKEIYNALNTCIKIIHGDDNNAGFQNLLSDVNSNLRKLTNIDKDLSNLYDDVSNLIDNTELISDKINSKLLSMSFDGERQNIINERLKLINDLKLKYGSTEEEILNKYEENLNKRQSLDNSEKNIALLTEKYDEYLEKTLSYAEKLSNIRKKISVDFVNKIEEQLRFLDMPNIKFVVDFNKGKLTNKGYDDISFLISTNIGEPPKPLSKVSSGGELSRIMLSLKNIIGSNDGVETMIFDEIDSGVSGKTSRKIGVALKNISTDAQVICVTHSAQIASFADSHYLISKDVKNDHTYTDVSLLDYDGRVHELTRIMGGLNETNSLIQSAEELLKKNDIKYLEDI